MSEQLLSSMAVSLKHPSQPRGTWNGRYSAAQYFSFWGHWQVLFLPLDYGSGSMWTDIWFSDWYSDRHHVNLKHTSFSKVLAKPWTPKRRHVGKHIWSNGVIFRPGEWLISINVIRSYGSFMTTISFHIDSTLLSRPITFGSAVIEMW